ncbi:hypothetical protein [Cohnella sp. GCM10027633]|uniref:hypothetical protein n=1 Tax=unclassified Cohnella TaxID=2636738 RepID=UPI003644BC22
MREDIERVIAELEVRKKDARMMYGTQRGTLSAEGYGRYIELKQTIEQLEEVLASEDHNTRNTPEPE